MEIDVKEYNTHNQLSTLQFETENIDSLSYISLSRAIENKLIKITEISQSADVNNLLVINKSDKYVFIMDGDILEGAKQNRVLNSSVFLPPKSKSNLPVSCVEQGRWNYVSNLFSSSDYTAPPSMRARKSKKVRENLNTSGLFEADQEEVWDAVGDYSDRFSINSNTSNLSDVSSGNTESFDKFVKSFNPNKQCNGLAVFARKNLLGIDIFNRSDIFCEYFSKIIKGAAFEIYNLKNTDKTPSEKEAYFKTVNLLDEIENSEYAIFEGIGEGEERRMESNKFDGFELSFCELLVHKSVMNLDC